MIKKTALFIILAILCLSCTRKQETEVVANDNENIAERVNYSINSTLYVIPSEGLNLRTEPNTTSSIIKLLTHNTEVTVLEKSDEIAIIGGIHDYWYKVDIENEIGWAFGGYLARYPIVINSNGKQIPKFIYDLEIKMFHNGIIFTFDGAIVYTNNDQLIIYTNNNKESNTFTIDDDTVYLISITETPGWFYAVTKNAEALGYIYIYDISEKSSYGDIINKEASELKYPLEREYLIVKNNKNINRYGPLLQINHNNKQIEFINTFNGLSGSQYFLLDYYPVYNEILIDERGYEDGKTSIYNLDFEEYRCEYLANYHLYFNNSRTYLFSLYWSYGGPIFPDTKIYKIENGVYRNIYDGTIYGLSPNFTINSISWTNDNEVTIDCSTGIVQIIIGNEVVINNNLENSDNQFEY